MFTLSTNAMRPWYFFCCCPNHTTAIFDDLISFLFPHRDATRDFDHKRFPKIEKSRALAALNNFVFCAVKALRKVRLVTDTSENFIVEILLDLLAP